VFLTKTAKSQFVSKPGSGSVRFSALVDRSALIPFTTPHYRGFRISAFCGELQKAEFERNVIRKRTLAGLKAARARGRVGGRPEKRL
jgi:DNA invertase Pin-like site-specific DNA recombinase